MALSEKQGRCVVCGVRVRAGGDAAQEGAQSAGFLAYLDGTTMRLLGDLCVRCKERLDQEEESAQDQEEEEDPDAAE